jgi:hypothetical protein
MTCSLYLRRRAAPSVYVTSRIYASIPLLERAVGYSRVGGRSLLFAVKWSTHAFESLKIPKSSGRPFLVKRGIEFSNKVRIWHLIFEKAFGRYGDKVKFRIAPRLGAAELLSKLRGWVKDDGRSPIVANFNFDFGPKPVNRTAPKLLLRSGRLVQLPEHSW